MMGMVKGYKKVGHRISQTAADIALVFMKLYYLTNTL